MKRLLLASALGVMGLAWATPASAQLGVRADWNYGDEAPQGYNESRRVAYDNGYREGLRDGERAARRRAAFDFRDERTWQRADKGYHRSFGDWGRYQQSFRNGYESGYAEGYRRVAPGYGGGYGGGRVPVYPNTRGDYGYGGYSGQGGYGYGSSPAFANGVRDGYEKGRQDARDRNSFDPQRHRWYRAGDHDYRSQYGPRRQYEDIYRRGFQEGYERGYREWRR
jgi:hypothetical protein